MHIFGPDRGEAAMELKELEYVVAIAKEGSISAAAEKLYMAQSSLSQFLSRYETELKTKLFVRKAGGVRPTDAGELFLENAQQMLRQYHRLKTELQERGHPRGGRIELGISTFRGAHLLPRVLRRFSQKYPDVQVIIHEFDSFYLRRKILIGELDMALVALRPDETGPEDTPVMQDEVYLLANPSHPVMEYVQTGKAGPWVALEDAARFEFVLSNPNTVLGATARDLFAKHEIQPIVHNGNLSAPFAAAMARNNQKLAFTYRSCALPDPGAVYLSVGRERCFVNLVLIYPPDGYRSLANHALETIIRQYIDKA